MRSRAWVAILAMGFLGVLIMGFMTKFAVDANPDLQKMIRFKVAMAQEFESCGLEEISLRKGVRSGAYSLHLTGPREKLPMDPSLLDMKLSRYFAKNFPDKTARVLEISYVLPQKLGCTTNDPYHRKEYFLSSVRASMVDEERIERIGQALEKDAKGRVLSGFREGRTLLLVVEAPARLTGDLRQLASQVEPVVREQFRAEPYAALKLRVQRPAAGSPADRGDFVEVQFDPRGRELRG